MGSHLRGGSGLGLVGVHAVFGLFLFSATARADPYLVTVKGNGTELGETPIVAPLDANWASSKYQLQPRGGGPPVPARTLTHDGKSYLAFVLKHVPADGELRFGLESDGSADRPGTGVEFRRSGTNFEIGVGGKPFVVYRNDEPTKPYFYPVFGPTGAEITRAYPIKTDVPGEDRDHPHHRSFWFTHGDVNGVDFWATDPLNKPKPNSGTIRETSRDFYNWRPVLGDLITRNDWVGPDGKTVCTDRRLVRIYDTSGARILDFDITITAKNGPVTFGDTKEGTFGLRLASSMDVERGKTKGEGKIINAEGVTDDAAWGKASPWVDYVGPVAGKTVGVAILNHPESFRYPTTWHVRTYGLFAANPFGWHDFGKKTSVVHSLALGDDVTFRYRVILHEGDTASAHIAEAFAAYARPPVVTLRRAE